jgi:hypothetical protein
LADVIGKEKILPIEDDEDKRTNEKAAFLV